jgi:hypothetical protein
MNEPRNIRDVSQAADATVVAVLERFLTMAKSGEIRGVIMLGDSLGATDYDSAGTWNGPKALWAFECWKHRFLHSIQEAPL